MARTFYIKAENAAGNCIMTSIQVIVPDHIQLFVPDEKWNDGRRVDHNAVAWALGKIVEELARYGLSECLLAYEPPKQ